MTLIKCPILTSCHTTEGGRQVSRSNTEFIKQRHKDQAQT